MTLEKTFCVYYENDIEDGCLMFDNFNDALNKCLDYLDDYQIYTTENKDICAYVTMCRFDFSYDFKPINNKNTLNVGVTIENYELFNVAHIRDGNITYLKSLGVKC